MAGAVDAKDTVLPMIDDENAPAPYPNTPAALGTKPTTYKDAVGQLKESKDVASMVGSFMLLMGLVCGGIFFTACLTVLSLIPLYLLIVGSVNVNNCPAERLIPVFLIVTGVFCVVRALVDWYYKFSRSRMNLPPEEAAKPSPISGIIGLFLLIWFICGAVWVFRTAGDVSYDKNATKYCDQLTFMSAYVYVIVCLAILGLTLLLLFLSCCCLICIMAARK